MNGAALLLGGFLCVAGSAMLAQTMVDLGASAWQIAVTVIGVMLGTAGAMVIKVALGGLSRRCETCGSWHQND